MDAIEEIGEKTGNQPSRSGVGASSSKSPLTEESKEPRKPSISAAAPRIRQSSGETTTSPTAAALPIQYQTLYATSDITDCRSIAVAEFNARGRSGTNVRSDAVITG
jgi:hypothetical protein